MSAVQAMWPDAEVVLIGALAVGHHIPMDYRDTSDVDLALSISMDEFPGPMVGAEAKRAGWSEHKKMEHRFFSPDDEPIDLLPAGPDALKAGFVEWPKGFRMSVVGFDLAFGHNETVEAGEVLVRVPSAPVLAFLKMRSWLDRPQKRSKDLEDLTRLMTGYVDDDADRRWTDAVCKRSQPG